ncbi:oxidoreductase [Brevibacillus dissolubilis]|uniref:oxidoreductase n=1 Tax=Brevibacillus dissolubilis TaxID=1844116 RepID=UPI00111749B1|nr:oxidoreductase [Brevibacillus dissolubilis]
MSIIRAGLVGYGLSGSVFQAPVMEGAEGLVLHKVVSSRPEDVHADYPEVTVVSSYDELLSDPDIDLVIITTPNTTHFPYAKQALEAGKHVVVEKPFVNRSADALELIELAQQKQRVLSVYHNRRWDNDFLTVKELIESGELGEINTYEAHYDRFRPEVKNRWREQNIEGSGSLYDLGSHLIDQALHLFGLPEAVYGDSFVQRVNGQAPDYFHLVLYYGNRRVILHCGSIVKEAGPHFQVHGSKGSYIKYGMDSQEDQLRQGKKPGAAGWGEDSPERYGQLTLDVDGETITRTVETRIGGYEKYYQGIVDAILHGKEVPVSAVDGMNVIKVIELAMVSVAEGRVVPFK